MLIVGRYFDNMEDSVIINKSAVDRGLFKCYVYKTYKDEEKKNVSMNTEEEFCNPLHKTNCIELKPPETYAHLNKNGFVKPGTFVKGGDVIIGKVIPCSSNTTRQVKITQYKDASLCIKKSEEGVVDRVVVSYDEAGYKIIKVRIREERNIVVGDKMSSRHGQKGTCGMLYRQEDMPFTKDGIVPDIIINAHALPSRMTIGQIIECLLGKLGAINATFFNGTPFIDDILPLTEEKTHIQRNGREIIKEVSKKLEELGFNGVGEETLYNGQSGRELNEKFFIGPTFYQRLKHMVKDKVHCLTLDHEVLTNSGWKFYNQLSKNDKIATLKNNELVYEYPNELLYWNDYSGQVYEIDNTQLSIKATMEHRMYVDGKLQTVSDILDKSVKYKRNAIYKSSNHTNYSDKLLELMCLLLTNTQNICMINPEKDIYNFIQTYKIKFDYKILEENIWFTIHNSNEVIHQIISCLLTLDKTQAIFVIEKLFKSTPFTLEQFKSDNKQLLDILMILCLHAGFVGTIHEDTIKLDECEIENSFGKITEINEPVFCLQVPSEIFYVRRNGKGMWTGNSRSRGPVQNLTRQAAEGRLRHGGLRLGEMEVNCMEAHGAALFLQEKMFRCSDEYYVDICNYCGQIAITNPEKDIYNCRNCNNFTEFTKIGIPYACKLFFQELQGMMMVPRISTK